MDPNDKMLLRDAKGNLLTHEHISPDWPLPGEVHERKVLWSGTDEELKQKLAVAQKIGGQINAAKLEYSPLWNNSNGVTSNLLKAIDVAQTLPLDNDKNLVDAPDFGQPLHQNIGILSHFSGYSLDGTQWRDDNGQPIQPPHPGEPTVPLEPFKTEPASGIFDSRSSANHAEKPPGVDGLLLNDPRIPATNSFAKPSSASMR